MHTASEFHDALTRAERLLEAGEVRLNTDYPVAFVLHGPEVHVLERANYAQHKDLVDLAARLSALGVVEIKACERWMGGNGVNPASLHAFVGTVPWGTAEEQRLRQQSYISF